MDLVTVSSRAPDFAWPGPARSDLENTIELAASIRRNFQALAETLERAAEFYGETDEGHRLRLATAAARRGQQSADRLMITLRN